MLFDIAPSEMLLTAIIAVVVIGPKDLPLALRTAGRWLGKMRRVSGHFRTGIETMIREAELADMEKKWREQNEAIMHAHPHAVTVATPALVEHAPSDDAQVNSSEVRAFSQHTAASGGEPDYPARRSDTIGDQNQSQDDPQLPLSLPQPTARLAD
jgi:sec-independent protein translocase protein TatB